MDGSVAGWDQMYRFLNCTRFGVAFSEQFKIWIIMSRRGNLVQVNIDPPSGSSCRIEACSMTLASNACSTSDTVHVIIDGSWEVIVHHVLDFSDVKAARCHIRRHQYTRSAVLEV